MWQNILEIILTPVVAIFPDSWMDLVQNGLYQFYLLILFPDGVKVILSVSLKLGLKVIDLRVQSAHPLLHPLQDCSLLLKLCLDVIINLDENPILIIHMTKSFSKGFESVIIFEVFINYVVEN